ncbi:alpha/beta hydrolase [Brevundimonas sp.]|uniref:alpha/beta fold hydrolase n=1 Tax=Brevundimonas sp. TaxID=1871086 RepID=UPI002D2C9DCD|nr:alpha/beta hydrolase [Brevundimonas sp.]HYD27584.1 alpha/beta hydrolase [Brevundimonas sp.]
MKARLLPALALALGALIAGSPAEAWAQTARTDAVSAPPERRSGVAVSSGVRIHYDVWGDLDSGVTPLIVLHGAYMSADAMTPFVERFARTRPVIVLDQRGHGRTGDAPGPLAYEAGLSEASVNERFRSARRKTGMGSCREVARLILAQENRHEIPELVPSGPSADEPRRLDAP